MGIRKSATRMTDSERNNFLRAVLTLKNTIANPTASASQQISIYDQFVAIHLYAININFGATIGLNMGHHDSAFCPWHRKYLHQFEQALQAVDPTVTLPYWDWTDQFGTENILFQDNFIGPDGTTPGTNGNCVMSGYFAFNRPGTAGNPTPLPPWYTAAMNGWKVRPSLAQAHFGPSDPTTGKTLLRDLSAFTSLETQSHIQTCLSKTVYESTSGFRKYLENRGDGLGMHDAMHSWVGGNMRDPNSSPNDIIFFLHHCNIDRLWAMWQIDDHRGSAFYPSSGRPQGHNLNDVMWPWVGTATGYSSGNAQADIELPDFSVQPVIHPVDVLDHRALGYSYDTEAVIGIALDQTGSMMQMTPDPMIVSAPDVTKWEAAKRGVAALLHDCETAYLQRECYVIAGIETFRTLATNVFTPVFPGVPYGIIKNGSPSSYSETGFISNIAAQSPAGGTPLADALLHAETNMVRPPLGNLPVHDTRFLCMLTDGLLTNGAPLSSIMPHQLQDTIIFAMGFGTGADVDYGTIADIVSKGKAAPPLGAMPTRQVYHGENAGEINKFFTNSVAHALGYTPVMDPLYELYPGEHVDTPFYVSEADQSFMITVQGFDYDDENWSCCLILPDGSSCSCDASCDDHGSAHDHEHSHGHEETNSHVHDDFLVTTNSKNGRITVFLNRNGAEEEHWIGPWRVRVMYKMNDVNMRMYMPSLVDRLFPTGARPVRGPVYAQYNWPYQKRVSARLLPSQTKTANPISVTGLNENRTDPCAVAVNIYCRSTLHVQLKGIDKKILAGADIALRIEAKDHSGAKVTGLNAVARLVAPNFSTGNIYAHKKARLLASKRKYQLKTNSRVYFNEPAFMADFETQNPGSLSMIDRIVEIKSAGKDYVTFNLKENKFPGIYRIGIQVSGTIEYNESSSQPFSRLLNFEIPVGLKIDLSRIVPSVRVQQNAIHVSYSLADNLGNIASPAIPHNPVLLINGKEVAAKFTNDYTGTYQLAVKFSGKQLQFSANRKKIARGDISVSLKNGQKLNLKAGDSFNLQLRDENDK
jgi:hypothetical protein